MQDNEYYCEIRLMDHSCNGKPYTFDIIKDFSCDNFRLNFIDGCWKDKDEIFKCKYRKTKLQLMLEKFEE